MRDPHYTTDIAAIQSISSVPTILEAVAALTGMRFVCISHVTSNSWTTCAVLDKLDFGLKVGDGLDVTTTLCEEVRNMGQAIVIEHVENDERYRDHHTPRIYGFQSYISIPIWRPDGSYFGALCALDPEPAKLSNTATLSSMTLFAQLITQHLESTGALGKPGTCQLGQHETSELCEQMVAVLGHDLRTPLSSILLGAELLENEALPDKARSVLERMRTSAVRMAGLVNDVVDFTRGRMGGGIALTQQTVASLHAPLMQVVDELRGQYPERTIEVDFRVEQEVICDVQRIQQMLSNLLKNALVYGDASQPVTVQCTSTNGIFRLSIINHGPVMAQGMIDQLFKPFWRAKAHASNQGLGLGLFIASEIARSHGGKLHVASADNETRFTFHLQGDGFVERRKKGRT